MTQSNRRTIRRHMIAAGYSGADISNGLAFAANGGATNAREGYILAMSRVLYSDEDLAEGARFGVEAGYGPR